MKNSGAQTGRRGGTTRERVPAERPPRLTVERFAPSPGVVGVAAAPALAFSRRLITKHGLPSVAGTLRFLDAVARRHLGGEMRGLGAGMVYREPGGSSVQWFCTWFLKSVLTLTVNQLEQNFGAWLNQFYLIQAHPNLARRFYLEHDSRPEHFPSAVRQAQTRLHPQQVYAALTRPDLQHTDLAERRSYLGQLSYLERRFYSEHPPYPAALGGARDVRREASSKQLAPRGDALPEPFANAGAVEGGARQSHAEAPVHPYAGHAGQSYTHVLHQPSRQSVQLWMQTYLVGVLRAFESRVKAGPQIADGLHAASLRAHAAAGGRDVGTAGANADAAAGAHAGAARHASEFGRMPALPFLNVVALPSGVFVAPGQAGGRVWAERGPAGSRELIALSRELNALLLSARVMAAEIKEAYESLAAGALVGTKAGTPAVPREVYAGGAQDASAAALRGAHGDALIGGIGGGLGNRVGSGAAEFVSRLPLMLSSVARTHSMSSNAAGRSASLPHTRLLQVTTEETARRGQRGVQTFPGRALAAPGAVSLSVRGRASEHSFDGAETRHAGTPPGALLDADSARLDSGRDGASAGFGGDVYARMPNPALAAANMLASGVSAPGTPAARGFDIAAAGFALPRRAEEQMRPPTQTYAFAQPSRPAPTEAPVVKHVWEQEVQEIVKKEVAAATKSVTPLRGLSRADYTRIADHVYSSLARRLMVEKERTALSR